MVFRFGVLVLLAGFFLSPVAGVAAEPASVEALNSSLQAPGFSPLFNSGSALPPISVPEVGSVAVGQPAVLPEMEAAQMGAAEPRRPAVGTEEPKVQLEVSLGQAEVRPAVGAPHAVRVVEAPRAVSFERLRRELYRHPDLGLTERFVEIGSELPPLFGEEF